MRARPLVLVIDDSDDTRDLLASVLRLEGFVVMEAHDGHEGLKIAFESRPDIIIADLQMPVMDGWRPSGAFARTAARATSRSSCVAVKNLLLGKTHQAICSCRSRAGRICW